jgi:2-octaprenylphenol hydroxylase
VAGGGPVGASLACAARGLRCALLAHERPPAAAFQPGIFDPRVYALSPGNVAFLRELGAWQAIAPERITAVHAMQIYGDDGASALRFDAYRAGVPELACIVEDSVLQQALWKSVAAQPAIEILAPARCERIEAGQALIQAHLADGRALSAALLVGADGAGSIVRQQSGIAVREREYGQAALVANFSCERAHSNAAYQWFSHGAVLALLPLPGDHVSMVWSLPAADAQRLGMLDEQALCREVEAASRRTLGELAPAGARRTFPLRRLAAARLIAPRVALAGDAAHVIHPLAGQGLNLGLQDARVLASVLAAREPVRDPGDARLLRRYERRRAEPILAMDVMVDGLFRTFGLESRTASRMRNAGLNLADRVPVLKNILMRHAMS